MSGTVLVTRDAADCAKLQSLVEDAGIRIVPYPVFRLEDVHDRLGWQVVDTADPGPEWLLMASPRAPERFVRSCRERGSDHLLDFPVAVIGDGTAKASSAAGLAPEVVGPGTGLGLAEKLLALWSAPTVVLFACGLQRRPELPNALADAGHQVLPVVLYRMGAVPKKDLPAIDTTPDAVVITSPRAARLYLAGVGGQPLPCPHWALGPTTRDAASEMGVECSIPPKPSLESLAEELCRV